MSILVVEPGKAPYEKDIDFGLESLQKEVGGPIEAVYPYDDPVALIVNEEGKLDSLPLNRALRDEEGEIYDIVAGTFIIVGLGEESFGDLDKESMARMKEQFRYPEEFFRMGSGIMVVPVWDSPGGQEQAKPSVGEEAR